MRYTICDCGKKKLLYHIFSYIAYFIKYKYTYNIYIYIYIKYNIIDI